MANLKNIFSDPLTTIYTTQPANVGKERRIEGGNEYLLMKATGTIAANAACKHDTSDPTGQSVVATASVGDDFAGVNEAGALTSGQWFWMTVRGVASCKILTAATVGTIMAPTATAGVLGAPANTDVAFQKAISLEAGAATNAAKRIRIY
jgi:hypothetical protein